MDGSSSELIVGAGGGISALAATVTLGIKAIDAWRDRKRLLAERDAARVAEAAARAERDALLDTIPARVEEAVVEALAKLPARSPSVGAMPSTEALRRLIEGEVEAYARRHEAAQDAHIEGLRRRLDDVHHLLTEALRRGAP